MGWNHQLVMVEWKIAKLERYSLLEIRHFSLNYYDGRKGSQDHSVFCPNYWIRLNPSLTVSAFLFDRFFYSWLCPSLVHMPMPSMGPINIYLHGWLILLVNDYSKRGVILTTLPETNSSPMKIPIKLLVTTIKLADFHGRPVSFREGFLKKKRDDPPSAPPRQTPTVFFP